jgi:hypothetical protein
MMVRGIRVNQWLEQRSVQNLVRRLLPRTFVWIQHRDGHGKRHYDLWWEGSASEQDMRALADEIEAALPAKAAASITCRRP